MTGTLRDLGARPLLVACDYDGTLAPIVPRPEDATPQAGAAEALARLSHSRHVTAILTGRRATEIHAFLPLRGLTVIGLHGMEWPGEPLPDPRGGPLDHLRVQVSGVPHVRLEDKGHTLAVHYREAPPERHEEIAARLDAIALPEGWETVRGKKVLEFRPEGFGKGAALRRLVEAHPGHLPVFLGDDVTDEEGFVVLRGLGGVTVKVGEGDTAAEHRLADPAAVVDLLRAWGDPSRPPFEMT